ncbi:MAG: PEGA domain-containing protein [Phycisphaeraceae bacterium]|nr:PEGA domain-containing protein [Phycisphaeraceae bacterium]
MAPESRPSRSSLSLYALRCSLSSLRSLCLCGKSPLRLCFVIAAAATLSGCVERRISITSEPAGALVWVNDVEVGRTPAEFNYKHYGKYDVRLELDGYDTLQTIGEASTPWWDYPGPDLIAETIPNAKKTIRWHYTLTPTLATAMPREQFESDLIERARALREQLGPAPTPAQPSTAPAESVDPIAPGTTDDGPKPADAPDDDSARPDR